jgi:hypothetical protein
MDFEHALKVYYGDRASSVFRNLLTEHLVVAADLIKATKAGNTNTAAEAERKWYANADSIAAFLARTNPYWSQEHWRRMLHQHLGLVKAEAVYMLNKLYEESVEAHDEIELQSLGMADVMAEGMILQFNIK